MRLLVWLCASVAGAYEAVRLRGVLRLAAVQQAQARDELMATLNESEEVPWERQPRSELPAHLYRLLEKQRRRAEMVSNLLAGVAHFEDQISQLMERLEFGEDPAELVEDFCPELRRVLSDFSPETFARAIEPAGARPDGFNGLVLQSPRGVPVLVGRFDGSSEGAMRACAAAGDQIFRVRDGRGVSVLLRTSMARGLKGSKDCARFAADVAAWFSDSRYGPVAASIASLADYEVVDDFGVVEVAYADAVRVNERRKQQPMSAKQGKKKPGFKDKEKLGILRARPANVADAAAEWDLATEVPCWKLSLTYPALRSKSPRRQRY